MLDRDVTDDSRNPEDLTDTEQLSQSMQSALMGIKAEYRTVIVLKHFVDCSYSEISIILDIPEKKVKSRLYTGRQLLKQALTSSGIH